MVQHLFCHAGSCYVGCRNMVVGDVSVNCDGSYEDDAVENSVSFRLNLFLRFRSLLCCWFVLATVPAPEELGVVSGEGECLKDFFINVCCYGTSGISFILCCLLHFVLWNTGAPSLTNVTYVLCCLMGFCNMSWCSYCGIGKLTTVV